MASEGERAGYRVEEARHRAESRVQGTQDALGRARYPFGAPPAHGARANADEDVAGDEQQACRGEEHLPAAVQPVREGQGHQDRARYLSAYPDKRQQAAVAVEAVGVGSGQRRLRAGAPACRGDQDNRGKQ